MLKKETFLNSNTILICIIFILLSAYYFYITTNRANLSQFEDYATQEQEPDYPDTTNITIESINATVLAPLPPNCDKFVILTSIYPPTNDVKYINDALYGWCLIVVGDKKTPLDWSYKSAYYLSAKDQLELAKKLKIVKLIPFNSYLRKLVGYLFAIDNGAKFIYETDDDNSPSDGLFGFRYEKFIGVEANAENFSLFINPYSYFGQPSVWPRGYPLEKIADGNTNKNMYRIYEDSNKVPLIQQGLVNGDPDVDAVYRLTRVKNKLEIEFDGNSPPLVLNTKQYAPINSQNTFYHYDAFFALVFPLNATFRECDILRGYVSIRLLQEIDGRVAFVPPNAFQVRNAHSYHKDYLEEKRLFERIGAFVSDLDEWRCTKESVKECMMECVQMLVGKKHFKEDELRFYKTWIGDLDSAGYVWPKIKRDKDKNR